MAFRQTNVEDLMPKKRESSRVKESNQRKVLDEAARHRRLMKSLEALEQDNYHQDPHEDLEDEASWCPKFEDTTIGGKRRRKSKPAPFNKLSCRKNFGALLDDELELIGNRPNYINYVTAQVPPSRYPPRHFCAVCGFLSNYTCVQCGARYCCVKCYGIHKDTRCLKWTA